jgi:predicted nucleic acid-binding protein
LEKVFADTNIILDWLGKREPFFEFAKALFQLAEEKEIQLFISPFTFMTTEYILRKSLGKEKTKAALSGVRSITTICQISEKEIDLALLSDMKDFEDALQYFVARNNLVEIIITRNTKDFVKSELPVMTAEEYLKSKS